MVVILSKDDTISVPNVAPSEVTRLQLDDTEGRQ